MVNNFSIAFQKGTLSACEGQTVVKAIIQAINSVRSNQDFDLFWKYIEQRLSDINMSISMLEHHKNLQEGLK